MPIDKQGMNMTVGTVVQKTLVQNTRKPVDQQAIFGGLSLLTNCAILSITTAYLCTEDESDLCERDDGDLCKVEHGMLATAHSRMSQLPPHFSEASHAAKMFFFIAASLPEVKSSNLPPVSL